MGSILVVEDDDIEREMVSLRLTLAGHQVRAAASGGEGLETGDAPQVIVLDVGLPDMTGFELLPRLRAQRGWEHVPAIFLTGHDQGEEIVQGLHLKAAYITKPLIVSALFHAVHSALLAPSADP